MEQLSASEGDTWRVGRLSSMGMNLEKAQFLKDELEREIALNEVELRQMIEHGVGSDSNAKFLLQKKEYERLLNEFQELDSWMKEASVDRQNHERGFSSNKTVH